MAVPCGQRLSSGSRDRRLRRARDGGAHCAPVAASLARHREGRHGQDQPCRGAGRDGGACGRAPATGHGLSLLSAPSVVIDAVRMGPLRRNTDRVQELVTDASRTWVLPVTLAEELPVKETLELRARVRELGVGLGPVIANGVEPELGLPDPERALACVARLTRGAAPSPLAEPDIVVAAARHRIARNRMQREDLGVLARETGETPLELPWLASGVDGPDGVRALADELHEALA